MFRLKRKDSVIRYKLLYTGLILFVYILGRGIPLYGIDISAYHSASINAEDLLMQTISGDIYRTSVFAIGLSPYMLSSILVQIIAAFRSSDAKARTSPKKMSRITVAVTFVFAVLQALFHLTDLAFTAEGEQLFWAMGIAALQMVTGVMVILWLAERNQKYGIGGRTALIFVNILDGIISNIGKHDFQNLKIPFMVAFILIIIVLIMENTEKRIPLQRISIQSIYTDKNYLAIKLNPIGIMPVMFSTAFFMLPRLLVFVLHIFFPENGSILWCQENMELTRPLGIAVYIAVLYILTIVFSIVFVSPGDLTEQFLKSGDSIENLHAGRDTKRYLTRNIVGISFLSASVMSICVGIPLVLQLKGEIDSSLAMFPSSLMMVTGIWSNLYQEFIVIRNYDAYRPFI